MIFMDLILYCFQYMNTCIYNMDRTFKMQSLDTDCMYSKGFPTWYELKMFSRKKVLAV